MCAGGGGVSEREWDGEGRGGTDVCYVVSREEDLGDGLSEVAE